MGKKIKPDENIPESRARRINNLFNKYEKWKKVKYETEPFKEPIMEFARRSGDVEFYENATAGMFKYTHSDGTERFIILNPSKKLKFGFADKMYRGYWCHEDFPVALPDIPSTTAEQVNIVVEKSIYDIKEFETKALKARGEMWWKIALGVAVIIVAIALFVMLKPAKAPDVIQVIQPTVETAGATILG